MEQGSNKTWQHLILATVEAFISVYMTICCLVVGQKVLNQENRIFRFIADASYWIYLIHLPVLLFVQYLLLDSSWHLLIKLLLATTVTLTIGLITYLVFVRWTPLGVLLNGRRKKTDVQ